MRKLIVCGLLALTSVAVAAEATGVIPVMADNYSKLMYYQAELKGFPEQIPPRGGEPWGTQKWVSPEQTMAWQVNVAQAGQYAVAMLYLCKVEEVGSEFEITSGNSKLTGLTRDTGNAWRKPGWDRQEIRGTLKLAAGQNRIGLRIVKRAGAGTGEIIQMRALELVLPAVGEAIEERAAKQHPNTQWMVDAKYGLMTHWTPRTQPRHGAQKPYCEAVRDFDVEAYMKMIEETGAGYLVFTTGWGGFWFPGPIQAINSKMPGHGCDRDLVVEIADALHKRGLKLILYWGWTPGRDYATAWGQELPEFAKGLAGFLEEIGQRYGAKVDGLFFDGGYESRLYPNPFPYEMVTKAARAGNPNRVVSYNNWIFPKITSFEDFWIGESAHDLLPPPGSAPFAKGGKQEGMQAHLNTFLDDADWCHTRNETEMLPPWHTTEELVNYVKLCVKEKTVPSINLSIYQDGTVSPATLDQMRAVRKAIRGK